MILSNKKRREELAEYDVLDEAIINAKPDIVYKALLAEYAGETNWWMPNLEAKLRGGGAVDQPGTIIDITVHDRMSIKFTAKTDITKKNESLRFLYVEGAFRGEGTWQFEAVDGNTKLSFRWRCRPSGLLMNIVSAFVNIPKDHSKVMKAGFDSLNEYIKKRAEP